MSKKTKMFVLVVLGVAVGAFWTTLPFGTARGVRFAVYLFAVLLSSGMMLPMLKSESSMSVESECFTVYVKQDDAIVLLYKQGVGEHHVSECRIKFGEGMQTDLGLALEAAQRSRANGATTDLMRRELIYSAAAGAPVLQAAGQELVPACSAF